MRQKSKQKDAAKSQRINDPELKAIADYLCGLFSIPALTPLLRKQLTDLHNEYSYQDILLALHFFYELDTGARASLPDPPTIGIVPYVMQDALDFQQRLQSASDANQNFSSLGSSVVTVRIRPPSTSLPSSFTMADL